MRVTVPVVLILLSAVGLDCQRFRDGKNTKRTALPLPGSLSDMVLAAHVHPQRFRNGDRSVLAQVVLQEGNQHTGRSHAGVVQGMGQVLAAVSALYADLQARGIPDVV